MATRVELHKASVKLALEKALQSLQRSKTTAQPNFHGLIDQMIQEHQTAINTLTEIK